MSTNSDYFVSVTRNYIQGCIGRAKWHRDESSHSNWHEQMMREVAQARRLSQDARREIHKPSPKRYWCVMLHTGGVAGAHVSAADITYRVERDNPRDCQYVNSYWMHEPETLICEHAGSLRMYLMADEEWEALEIATSGFCQSAGVWDVTGLLAWGNQQHREWRSMRDAELAAEKTVSHAPQQIGLPI